MVEAAATRAEKPAASFRAGSIELDPAVIGLQSHHPTGGPAGIS